MAALPFYLLLQWVPDAWLLPRNAVALEAVVLAGGARVVPVVFTGHIPIDEVIYLQSPTVTHKWHLT
jgi:hypothetical protein